MGDLSTQRKQVIHLLALRAQKLSFVPEYYPERCDKILSRLRDMRGEAIYDARFGSRMKGGRLLRYSQSAAAATVLRGRRVQNGNAFSE